MFRGPDRVTSPGFAPIGRVAQRSRRCCGPRTWTVTTVRSGPPSGRLRSDMPSTGSCGRWGRSHMEQHWEPTARAWAQNGVKPKGEMWPPHPELGLCWLKRFVLPIHGVSKSPALSTRDLSILWTALFKRLNKMVKSPMSSSMLKQAPVPTEARLAITECRAGGNQIS